MKRVELLQERCVGCYACMNICPENAIEMQQSEDGFFYPNVREEKCINCGLCVQCCPVIKPSINHRTGTKAYGVINKDLSTRLKSSSGGAFSLVANYILGQGGMVVGAGIQNGYIVVHKCIENRLGLDELCGSKYVQSRINDVFSTVRRELDKSRYVLFSGSPCQVSGLYSYLGGYEYNNLITMDFVCHGAASPNVYERYVLDISDNRKIKSVSFRLKDNNGKSFFKINTETNDICIDAEKCSYLSAFSQNLILRRCCYKCEFRGVDRISDFTMGDLWGHEILLPNFGDNLGVSLVMVHSEKASKIFTMLSKQMVFMEINPLDAVRFNPSIVLPSKMSLKRNAFFIELCANSSVVKVLEKYTQRSWYVKYYLSFRQFIGRFRRKLCMIFNIIIGG